MIKFLPALKDTYITNKIISNVRKINSNVGAAGTLDLYKLYGINQESGSNATELSRVLVQFDLTTLKNLYQNQKIDILDDTFNVTMKLFDVYGGQPTPSNFTIDVYPLSRSFEEGKGRDIVKYCDIDSSNYYSSSYNNSWGISGAYKTGSVPTNCDYFTSLNTNSLKCSQQFITGEENLEINITSLISATLTNQIPDSGFIVSYDSNIENDNHSYFVKRFASRSAYNEDYHPRLIVKYDDSIQDDTQNLEFDSNNVINLYNYRFGSAANIISGSSQIELTGSNCITLKLSTPITSGTYVNYFSGSQVTIGLIPLTGTYTSNVFIQPSGSLLDCLNVSGSIDFTSTWLSNDRTVQFFQDTCTFNPQQRSSIKKDYSQYTVTSIGVKESHKSNEKVTIRVNVFDYKSPLVKLVKSPLILAGIVFKESYYQIRDYLTSEEIIPFDTVYNSTRLSCDKNGMYFDLDISNLKTQRSYVIDIMLKIQDNEYIYRESSQIFRVDNLR